MSKSSNNLISLDSNFEKYLIVEQNLALKEIKNVSQGGRKDALYSP
ncbi:MAG: hypothetical protein ACPLRT_07955 [Thermoproteota archaeon]